MDTLTTNLDFRLVFRATPALMLLLAPQEPFVVIDISDAMLAATLRQRDEVVGRSVAEAFPPNPVGESLDTLAAAIESFRRVVATHKPEELDIVKYDIRRPDTLGGGFEERYWRPESWPVLDESGQLVGLLHKTRDATAQVRAERARSDVEQELEEAEVRYRGLVEHLPAITFTATVTEPLQMLFVSPQVRALGIDIDEFHGDPECYWERLHPEDAPAAREAWRVFRRDGGRYDSEYRFIKPDGEVRWLRAQAVTVTNHGGAGFVQGIITDITDYKRIEAELRSHRDRLEDMVRQRTEAIEVVNRRLAEDVRRRQRAERALFTEKQRAQFTLASICDAVVTVDSDGRVDYINPAAEAVLGKKAIDIIGRSLVDFVPLLPTVAGEDGSPLVDILAIGGIGHEDVHFFRATDDERILEMSSTALYDSADLPTGAVIVFRDVTEERRRLHRLAHRARHDSLTGLPNRLEFERRLSNALDSAANGASHALLFIDLDHFKRVNDSGGHAAGDELLRQLARSLSTHLRERDTLARVGGDEFACLLEHCGPDNGMDAARALLSAVRKYALVWDGQTFTVGASIGLVPLQGTGITVEDAMQAADAASYAAKAGGRNDVCVRAPRKGLQLPEQDGWSERLAQALADDGFELMCQPIKALSGAHGGAYEVLLRLRKDGALVAAGAFMPSAERHGLAADIDRWVVRNAIASLARGTLAHNGEACFINLSSASLAEGRMGEYVEDQLREFKVAPHLVGFDIAESALLQHFRDAAQFVAAAKALGCLIALDDFANAIPVAPALKALGPDLIKISNRLVEHIGQDELSRAMVDAVNRIGHAMGGATVAKFPLGQDELELMRSMGIDLVQGNLVAAPQPMQH